MAKATTSIKIDLENIQEELVGTVNPGEVLEGEVKGDMFYFKMSQRKSSGKGTDVIECRLPVGKNGVQILEA